MGTIHTVAVTYLDNFALESNSQSKKSVHTISRKPAFYWKIAKNLAHLIGSNSQFCHNRFRNGSVTTILSYSMLNLLGRKKLTVLLSICVPVTVALSSKSPHGGHWDRLECFGNPGVDRMTSQNTRSSMSAVSSSHSSVSPTLATILFATGA